jgi:magnesium transporter
LSDFFQFHPLAVEDCLHLLQRPKVDDYGTYRFFVLHALTNNRARPDEVNLFVGKSYVVSFHLRPNRVIDQMWEQLQLLLQPVQHNASPENPGGDEGLQGANLLQKGADYLLYLIIDRIVDQYFPVLYKIDEELERLESQHFLRPTQQMINRVFKIRKDLLALRRTLDPFRDVVREIMHPQDEQWRTPHRLFFADIHDHLKKLVEMTDVYRQIGSDLIDSYISLNSQRMNRVMMTLTVITIIFMPLTFIVGVYGMNFDNMPELHWKYGYYAVLALMGVIAGSMVLWFKRKGWF